MCKLQQNRKPVIFLDRDGVLTKEKSYVCKVDDLEIFEYSRECVRKIKEKGYYAIVITNQSGVARGYFTEDELIEMNTKLQEETGVDAIYYCPHHEQGKVPQFTMKCNCRKPDIGMIKQACEDYSIDCCLAH